MILKGRASTEEDKRRVLNMILAAWLKAPDLRLGQLLANWNEPNHYDWIRHVEDFELADGLLAYTASL